MRQKIGKMFIILILLNFEIRNFSCPSEFDLVTSHVQSLYSIPYAPVAGS